MFSGGGVAGGVFSGGRCNFTVSCSHDCDLLSDVAAAELCMHMDRLCLFAALTARGCNGLLCVLLAVLPRSHVVYVLQVRSRGFCSMRYACQVCAVRPLPLHERLHIACSAAADESSWVGDYFFELVVVIILFTLGLNRKTRKSVPYYFIHTGS